MQLSEMAVGETARIRGFTDGSRAYRAKLLAMGLTPGTPFTVTRMAPMGDPVEVRVRGFALSLRRKEGNALLIDSEQR
ncbi:ferrous iron transport protein A [Hoeflea sp. TYP-13]|uniref:ferrous iron transport protein A n=1 Tax=Hoeflea sp. TYP-13 TaxID=3230023 RepID=UPI0034C612B8